MAAKRRPQTGAQRQRVRFGREEQRNECAPMKKHRSKRYEACSDVVEEDGFEPSKAKPADLQSVPFGHLGTPPYSILAEGWSWWTDSNPRPADYKSAALPAELHQHTAPLPFAAKVIITGGAGFVNTFGGKESKKALGLHRGDRRGGRRLVRHMPGRAVPWRAVLSTGGAERLRGLPGAVCQKAVRPPAAPGGAEKGGERI